MKVELLAIVLVSAALVATQENKTGAVQGMVVDENGRPAAHVRVEPIAENGAPYIGRVPFAITDDAGNFLLQQLPPGENRLFAVFTEGGYPDGRSGIFAGDLSLYQTVNIEPEATIKGVVLRLPRKGAVFRVHILDSSSGEPVLTSRIRITRPDVPKAFYESGPDRQGQFEIVLLPDVAFRVEIRAANYQAWKYSEVNSEGNQSSNLILKAETTRNITVKLERAEAKQQQ